MMTMRFIGIAILAITVGCTPGNDQQAGATTRSDQAASRELIGQIDSLEAKLSVDEFKTESPIAAALLESYIKYVELYPGNTEKCPEYLYKAAAISRAVNLPVKAIKYYDQILTEYPNYISASEAAFQIGFTYDNDLNEKDMAQEAYEKVIADFPGDLWAQQAQERLKTLHMTDDELIKSLMKQNNLN